MSDAIITALITGGLALIGVFISNFATMSKTELAIRVSQAVTETKLDDLTAEVRKHNNFAQRIPTLENQIEELQRRVSALEKKVG